VRVRNFVTLTIGLACGGDNTRGAGVEYDTLQVATKLPPSNNASDSVWQVHPLAVAPDRFRPGAWSDEVVLWGLVRGRLTRLNTQTGAVSSRSETAWSFFPAPGVVSWQNEGGTWMVRDGGKPIRLAGPGVDPESGLDAPPRVLWSPDGSRALLAWQGEWDSHYRLLERDGLTRKLEVATPGYFGNDAVLWLDSARVLFQIAAKSSLGGDPAYRESGWRGALAVLDLHTGAYAPVANTRDSTALRVAGRYLDDVLVMEWGSGRVRGHWLYDPGTWRRRPVSLPNGRAFSSRAGAIVILLGAVADSADAVLVTGSSKTELGRVAQEAEPVFSPSGRRGALRTGHGVIVFERQSELTFDALATKLGHPGQVWRVPDSVAWLRVRDSVTAQMTNFRARRFVCESDSRFPPRIQNSLYWWLPRFAVRLAAYPESGKNHPNWVVKLDSLGFARPC
jgi:hypothetical protein